MERKCLGKNFENLGIAHEVVLCFGIFRIFGIFSEIFSESALASSFSRDHNELDISHKDDGDANSIKGTLHNLSTYMSINPSYR